MNANNTIKPTVKQQKNKKETEDSGSTSNRICVSYSENYRPGDELRSLSD